MKRSSKSDNMKDDFLPQISRYTRVEAFIFASQPPFLIVSP